MNEERHTASLCPSCDGRGERYGQPCQPCQSTGYAGGREP